MKIRRIVAALIVTKILLFLTVIPEIRAQTLEEFKKQQEAEKRRFENEYNDGIKVLDKEFKDFLKKEWKRYELFSAEKRPSAPKPETTPVFKEPEDDAPSQMIIETPSTPEPKPAPETPEIPIIKKPAPPPANYSSELISFDFYGANINLRYDSKFKISFPDNISEKVIANKWEEASSTYYAGLTAQLTRLKDSMSLNDWGYYLLIKDLAEKISDNKNTQVFTEWFLLTKSNYRVRIAYYNAKLFLMLPSVNNIYEKPYYIFDGMKYYLIGGDGGNIRTYSRDYPDAKIVMNLNLYKPIQTKDSTKVKGVSFNFDNQQYSLNIDYNLNTINFYTDYPLADYNVYFDASIAPQTKESLNSQLTPLLQNMSEEEAVSLLLRFVQTAFKYETDGQQFGGEKMFFPDEMFFYPASDCEDRAVLFSYLVRELLGLKVVGLEYPGHMATAVEFSDDIEGSYVMYKGDKYVVCDPTYMNAPVGRSMPDYVNKKATVIELRSHRK